ncbi:MAG: nucleoside 2-deoxyribosyltransferase [Balneolia bacterium]|nr:nucleoside 2-deoxyribosyltransferase [Balneolia bacterium]
MNIYFSGSIRGGREDAALYRQLILELSKYGRVLTEHIGAEKLNEELTDEQIYRMDMNWLKECDLVVAEVTTPSLGVGYEIGEARAMGKRIICLYRPNTGRRVSAMVSGAPDIELYRYTLTEDAAALFATLLKPPTS